MTIATELMKALKEGNTLQRKRYDERPITNPQIQLERDRELLRELGVLL